MGDEIDLKRARRDAKALLRSARAGDPAALARMRPDRKPCLADAQRAVALELGELSWPALVRWASVPPLVRAAADGRVRDVRRLLEAGASADARDPATGGTALHVAARRGWLDVVSALVEWVPLDRYARDSACDSALDACAKGSVAGGREYRLVAEVLLANGLRPDAALAADAAPDVAALLARWLTDPPQRDEPSAELAELACAADAALFAHLAESDLVERRVVGDGFAFRTGLARNDRNGVVCSRLDPGTADREISDCLGWVGRDGAHGQWIFDREPTPRDLGAQLERAGCAPERTAVYMATRLNGRLRVVVPDDVEIELVADAANLARALAGGDAPDDGDPDVVAERGRELELLSSLGLAADRPLRHYLALRADVPIGFTSAFCGAGAVLLAELEVAPAARRGGVGRALVLRALSDAGRAGCRVAVLAPTRATRPFYERLGFAQGRYPTDRAFYTPGL